MVIARNFVDFTKTTWYNASFTRKEKLDMKRMTVKDWIEYLQTLPEDAEVYVVDTEYNVWLTCSHYVEADLNNNELYEYHEYTKTLYLGTT